MDQDNTASWLNRWRSYRPPPPLWIEHYNDMMLSVKKRKETALKLRAESSSTAFETLSLSGNNIGFYLFNHLPTELRIQIWRKAFRTPRIHISDLKNVRHSDIGSLMLVCKESRELGTSLQIPYFRLHPRMYHVFIPKQYFNPDIDTIFFTKYDLIPSHVMLHDGAPIQWSLLHESPQLQANSVAIPALSWQDQLIWVAPIYQWHHVFAPGSLRLLYMLGNPRTLSLVVGNMDLGWCSNPSFTEPSDPPFKCAEFLGPALDDISRGNTLSVRNQEQRIIPPTATWNTEARRVEDLLKQMKDDFIKNVGSRLQENIVVQDWERKMCELDIPEVKFVKVVEAPVH